MRKAIVVALTVLGLVGLVGCEKTTHANLDKWMSTKKGPGKLRAALRNGSIDPDLSAHAAQNIFRKNGEEEVKRALESMAPERRTKVVAKLAPRLWTLARIDGEMTKPSAAQEIGKDALWEIRPFADDATRAEIDGYLTDWLTGGYYEGRATAGRIAGATIMRACGPKAGERLIAEANRIIAAPDKDGRQLRIGDQLLLGLTASGSPDAVKLVVEIATLKRADETLTRRALDAVYQAFIDPRGLFPAVEPAALAPSLERLGALARDDDQEARVANDAVELIRAVGMPGCLPPLLEMVTQPHRDPAFRWVGANNAIRCGGATALTEVASRLSTSASYEAALLTGSVVAPLPTLGDKDALLTAARALTTHPSWVARWIAIEALAVLGGKAEAERIAALAKDKAKLNGYWGDQSGLPKAQQKAVPTLGQRAVELGASLK